MIVDEIDSFSLDFVEKMERIFRSNITYMVSKHQVYLSLRLPEAGTGLQEGCGVQHPHSLKIITFCHTFKIFSYLLTRYNVADKMSLISTFMTRLAHDKISS